MSDVGVVIDLDDQSIEQNKVVLDYTSRDFTAIRTQLVGLAKGLMPDWQTAGEASDFGTLLLELFAYVSDVMNFYIDRTASEAFLGTAVRRQSILYMADMMGYHPVGQQAASVQLNFTMQANDPDDDPEFEAVEIPAGTRVYNSSGSADSTVIFEMDHPITVNPGETVLAYASEGLSVEARSLGTCQGVPNTEFIILDKGVIFGSVGVQTREGYQVVTWTSTNLLSTARPTQAMFTTFLDEAGYTHIVFGDNSSGRIPPSGAEVFVGYRYGVGAAANDLAIDEIDTIAPIEDTDMSGLTVTNPTAPVGGSDPESIDSMRYSISKGGSRIKDRAVTLMDYADLAIQVPGVSKSVAYGTVYTVVRVKVAPPEGQADDPYMVKLCNSVEAYLAPRTMVGSTVIAEPRTLAELWQNVYIQATVHVQAAYNRAAVRAQVESVLRSLMSFDSVDFGWRVSMGAIYRAMLAVQGVEYAELTWLAMTEPVDDTNPGSGDTVTVVEAVWQHENSLDTGVPPAAAGGAPTIRRYRRNNVTDPTVFSFSSTDDGNIVRDFSQLHVGDHVIYRPVASVSSWMSFTVTAVPTPQPSPTGPTYWQVPVAKIDQATTIVAPVNGDKVLFSVVRYTPTPDSLGGVADIDTDELLIPRIEPTEVIETPEDYPDIQSEDERTHDGLWVTAVGGLPNT